MARKDRNEEVDDAGDLDGATETQALTLTDAGAIMPATFDDLINDGFSAVKTIKIGDPKLGGVMAYAGQLIAPGAPVTSSLPDGKGGVIEGELPTWVCHPAVLTKGEGGKVIFTPQPAITHLVITPHQLNGFCASLYKRIIDDKTGVVLAIGLFATRWDGKESIKGGARSLNVFSWREKLEKLENTDEKQAA
jgi:hypothetical protein